MTTPPSLIYLVPMDERPPNGARRKQPSGQLEQRIRKVISSLAVIAPV